MLMMIRHDACVCFVFICEKRWKIVAIWSFMQTTLLPKYSTNPIRWAIVNASSVRRVFSHFVHFTANFTPFFPLGALFFSTFFRLLSSLSFLSCFSLDSLSFFLASSLFLSCFSLASLSLLSFLLFLPLSFVSSLPLYFYRKEWNCLGGRRCTQ